jgi:hypothetical protein
MSRIRVEPEALRDALLHDRQQLSYPLFRVRRVDEVEVTAVGRGEFGHQAVVDPMRVDDDLALGSLPENLSQAHDRDGTRCDNVGQNLSRPYGRQLIDIADEQQRRARRQRSKDRPHQRHIDHRRLVNHQKIAVERLVLVAPEAAGPWVSFEKAMDGFRLEAGALGQTLGGATGRRTERDRDALGGQDLQQ